MKRFRTRSLLIQLGIIGTVAAIVPLVIVVLVAFGSSSSEEVFGDGEFLAGEVVVESEPAIPVLVASLIVGTCAVLVAWWWAARAVRPMTAISTVANQIQAGSLDRRIGLHDASAEVQELANSFDAMLDRLETASDLQRHLVEDASHELRTPLAALAVNTEVMLGTDSPTPADYRSYIARNEIMIERMRRSVDDLLEAARARHAQNRQVDNDLMAIVHRVVEQHRAIHPSSIVDVTGPEQLPLGLDGPSVERALGNLLTNTVEHGAGDAPVVVHVEPGDDVRLSVTDRGPGITSTELAHVFDRYYTTSVGDTHRGIGLALVKQVAAAHGHIEVTSPLPGFDHGTCFTIVFRRLPTR